MDVEGCEVDTLTPSVEVAGTHRTATTSQHLIRAMLKFKGGVRDVRSLVLDIINGKLVIS